MARILCTVLEKAGFEVQHVLSAEEADSLLERDCEPEIVFLGLPLPGLSGEAWLRTFRARHFGSGVIIVSGVTDRRTVSALLRSGADDSVTAPFDVDEVNARIAAVMRRCRKSGSPALTFDCVTLDPRDRSITVSDTHIQLTPTEFGIACQLAARFGHWVFAAELCETILGGTEKNCLEDLRVHVSNLRRKLRPAEDLLELQTRKNVGYRLTNQAHT